MPFSTWLLASSFLFGCLIASPGPQVVEPVQAAPVRIEPLVVGKSIKGNLAGGERHTFGLSLKSNQFLEAKADQKAIDVMLRLRGLAGQPVVECDEATMSQGPEILSLIVASGGKYQLEIEAKKGSPPGRYELTLVTVRKATRQDATVLELRQVNRQVETLIATGETGTATTLAQQALEKGEKLIGGAERLEVTRIRYNLAGLLFANRDFARAEPLYRQVLTQYEKVLGKTDPLIAHILHSLALLYQAKGDYPQAEPLARRSLLINEKVFGPVHPTIAIGLTSLGVLYRLNHENEPAEACYRRALVINETVFGANSPAVAYSLNNLASLSLARHQVAQAAEMYRRALAIQEKVLGPTNPALAWYLNNLATVYQGQGENAQAQPLLERSLAILEPSLGREHPALLPILNNLAMVFAATGQMTLAIEYQTRANEIRERDLITNLVTGSEPQKLLYLNQSQGDFNQTLALTTQLPVDFPGAASLGLTAVLRRKGRVLDSMANSLEVLQQRASPEDKGLFRELVQSKAQLAQMTLKGADHQSQGTYPATLHHLAARIENLEATICARSAVYQVQSQPITLAAIQKTIPPDAALVEFAVFAAWDAPTRTFNKPSYVVFVLKSTGAPVWTNLGEAAPIDSLVAAWRTALGNRLSDPEKEVKPLARQLDRMVMEPVRKLTGTTPHLLCAPDGTLNLIPLGALVDENGRYLIESCSLTYLTSGRDLLRYQTKITGPTKPPMVVADPWYSTGTGPHLNGRALRPLRSLKGTLQEGVSIKKLFPQATLLMQNHATEKAVKTAVRPELLHLATHGFFLGNTSLGNPAKPSGTREFGLPGPPSETLPAKPEINPLLLSGLFLAGANQGGKGQDDGILTALEIAGLDLWGTKLVVLSACHTGVGVVKSGDGVYGLRRGLVLAGSETQMMSLWAVSDEGTRELMVEFYTRLKTGEGRNEALRNLQLRMLKDPKRSHPFFWAGFIQSGEWANLAGIRP